MAMILTAAPGRLREGDKYQDIVGESRMKLKPLICFDLDGTLVDAQGQIHPRDVEILRQVGSPASTQATFIPCTGRLLPSVSQLFARHRVSPGQPLPFPLVLQNGAALYAPGERLLAFYYFPGPTRDFLVDLIQSSPQVASLIFSEKQVYVHHPTPFAQAMLERFDLDARPFLPEDGVDFSKVMALSPDPEALKAIEQATRRDEIEQSYSLETVLELTPSGVHKGRGLGELLAGLGLEATRLLVAGDGGNDLSLFELTPHTFAPSTAPAEIQAAAGQVIETHETGLLAPLLEYAGMLR